jgi:hypothetical protein
LGPLHSLIAPDALYGTAYGVMVLAKVAMFGALD